MTPRKVTTLAALVSVLGLGLSVAGAQTVVYVDDDAPPGGDGAAWSTAYKYLQDALALATAGDEIRVAGGTHKPDQDEAGNVTAGERTEIFRVYGVGLYGGYRGCPGGDCGAGDPDERNIVLHETILSGDLNGDDEGGGAVDSDCCAMHDKPGCDNDTCEAAVCARFPICCSTEWTLTCMIEAAAVCCELCSDRNNCDNSYHVVSANGADTVLDGLTIQGGNAVGADGSVVMGGGILTGIATIIDCTFRSNVAVAGGAMAHFGQSLTVINSVFIGNRALNDGGAVFNDLSTMTLTNCTIAGNQARTGGGIRNYAAVELTLVNCILWGNTADNATGEAAQIENTASSTVVNYTCIEGWTGMFGGEGNTGDDPLFVDADGPDNTYGTNDDNLRLQIGSSALDTGDNSVVTTSTDINGNPRVVDGDGDGTPTVDMGAYEFQPTIPAVSDWGLVVTAVLVLTGGTLLLLRRRSTER